MNLDETWYKLQEDKSWSHSFNFIGVEGSMNVMENLRTQGVPVVSKREYKSEALLLLISRGRKGRWSRGLQKRQTEAI